MSVCSSLLPDSEGGQRSYGIRWLRAADLNLRLLRAAKSWRGDGFRRRRVPVPSLWRPRAFGGRWARVPSGEKDGVAFPQRNVEVLEVKHELSARLGPPRLEGRGLSDSGSSAYATPLVVPFLAAPNQPQTSPQRAP